MLVNSVGGYGNGVSCRFRLVTVIVLASLGNGKLRTWYVRESLPGRMLV